MRVVQVQLKVAAMPVVSPEPGTIVMTQVRYNVSSHFLVIGDTTNRAPMEIPSTWIKDVAPFHPTTCSNS